jgi:hypothetical protein
VGLGVLVTGLVVQIAGMSLPGPLVVVGVALIGAGQALALTPATNVAMASVPEDRAGMASGILGAQRAVGSTAGYAVLGSVLAAWLTATLGVSLRPAIPERLEREAVVEAVAQSANPRAHAADIVVPGTQLETLEAGRAEIRSAVEDDFTRGVQIALGGAAAMLVVVMILDWRFMGADPVVDDAAAAVVRPVRPGGATGGTGRLGA